MLTYIQPAVSEGMLSELILLTLKYNETTGNNSELHLHIKHWRENHVDENHSPAVVVNRLHNHDLQGRFKAHLIELRVS